MVYNIHKCCVIIKKREDIMMHICYVLYRMSERRDVYHFLQHKQSLHDKIKFVAYMPQHFSIASHSTFMTEVKTNLTKQKACVLVFIPERIISALDKEVLLNYIIDPLPDLTDPTKRRHSISQSVLSSEIVDVMTCCKEDQLTCELVKIDGRSFMMFSRGDHDLTCEKEVDNTVLREVLFRLASVC